MEMSPGLLVIFVCVERSDCQQLPRVGWQQRGHRVPWLWKGEVSQSLVMVFSKALVNKMHVSLAL